MTLGLAAAVALTWWLYCIVPLQQRVVTVQRQYEQLVGEQSALDALAHEVRSLESQIAVLQTEFRSAVGSSGVEYKRLLNAVLVYVVESGLALENCSLKLPETQKLGDKPWCTKHPVELSVSGSFAQLVSFFQKLASQHAPIFVMDFTVQKEDDAGPLKAQLNCVLLEVNHA